MIKYKGDPLPRTKLGTGTIKPSPALSQYTNYFYLILFSFIILTLLIPLVSPAQSVNVVNEDDNDVEIPEEFVSGFFNEISYEAIERTTHIELNHPDSNRTYEWFYEDGWEGSMNYIDLDNTSYSNGRWSVMLGVHEDEPTGNWTLLIEDDIYNITVVESDPSFSVSGDVNFHIEPGLEETYSAQDSVTFRNTGNVPMEVSVDHEDENLIYNIPQKTFEPGESGEITFNYTVSTGGAEKFFPSVSIQPYAVGAISLEGDENVKIISQEAYSFSAGVTIGYEGFRQIRVDDYSVQYKESIDISGDSTGTATFYIYPEESVLFDIEGENISFTEDDITISIDNNDLLQNIDLPKQLDSDFDEVEVRIEFESHHEDDRHIDLIVDEDTYTTDIIITDPSPQPDDPELTILEEQTETITLGIILIVGVSLFILGRLWLANKEE